MDKDIYIMIGNNIKKRRLNMNYTIKELAIITNLDYNYLKLIEENGVPDDITIEILTKICNGLNISILDLFKA